MNHQSDKTEQWLRAGTNAHQPTGVGLALLLAAGPQAETWSRQSRFCLLSKTLTEHGDSSLAAGMDPNFLARCRYLHLKQPQAILSLVSPGNFLGFFDVSFFEWGWGQSRLLRFSIQWDHEVGPRKISPPTQHQHTVITQPLVVRMVAMTMTMLVSVINNDTGSMDASTGVHRHLISCFLNHELCFIDKSI